MNTSPRYSEGRRRAFKAARLAIEEDISQEEAADRCGSTRSSVQEAMMILLMGTEAEIAAIDANQIAMGPLADTIRARTTPEERKASFRKPTKSPVVQDMREFDAEVWGRMKQALEILTGMPAAADVVGIVRKNVNRTDHVTRKVLPAHTWLEEFVNAWTQ